MVEGTKRLALIINGDTEERHTQNVERSLSVLNGLGYETYVASTQDPGNASHYTYATAANIEQLVEEMRSQLDGDDELFIYTTGHGVESGGEGRLCTSDGCDSDELAHLLDITGYGKRTVVMDQCYSGNWGNLFLDDPSTLFIALGSENETVCCGEFAPNFWYAGVPDANGDGIVGWQERFAYAFERTVSSTPQLLMSAGYVLDGAPAFGTNVLEVETRQELDQAIASLGPGQYAIVELSIPGCAACTQYAPAFDGYAAAAGGQHLFVRTENEDIGASYGITSFPTVMIVDHKGNTLEIDDRYDIFQEMTQFNIPLPQRLAALRKKFLIANERSSAVRAYRGLIERLDPDTAVSETLALAQLFENQNEDVRASALYVFAKLVDRLEQSDIPEAIDLLKELFFDPAAHIRNAAIETYEALGQRMGFIIAMMRIDGIRERIEDAQIEAGELARAIMEYGSFAGRMDDEEAACGITVLEDLVDHPSSEVVAAVVYAHARLARRLGPEKIRQSAVLARSFFGVDYKSEIEEVMAFNAYALLHDGLPNEEMEAGEEALRRALQSPHAYMRGRSAFLYGHLSDHFNLEEAALTAEAIRDLFNDDDVYVRRMSIYSYAMMAPTLRGDEIEDGLRALKRIFTDHDEDVVSRKFAITGYARLIRLLPPNDVNSYARALRNVFGDTEISCRAIPSYASLADVMGENEAYRGAKKLRELFRSSHACTRSSALQAYEKIVPHLADDHLQREKEKIVHIAETSNDEEERKAAIYVLDAFKDVLSSEEVDTLFDMAEQMAKDTDEDIWMRLAGIGIFESLRQRMSPEVIEPTLQWMREIAVGGDFIMLFMTGFTCSKLLKGLGTQALNAEAQRLRSVFSDVSLNKSVRQFSCLIYGEIAREMEPAEAALGAPLLREMFIDTGIESDLRETALIAYGKFADILSEDELSTGLDLITGYANDENENVYVIDGALIAVGEMAQRLNDEQVASGAMTMMGYMRNDMLHSAASNNFIELSSRLDPGITADGASIMRRIFTDPYEDELLRYHLVDTYKAILNKLGQVEMALETSSLTETMLAYPDDETLLYAEDAFQATMELQ